MTQENNKQEIDAFALIQALQNKVNQLNADNAILEARIIMLEKELQQTQAAASPLSVIESELIVPEVVS